MEEMMKGGRHGGMCEGGSCDCSCTHHWTVPLLIVAFGLTFLLGAFNVIDTDTVNLVWPIIIILAGLKKLIIGGCRCC